MTEPLRIAIDREADIVSARQAGRQLAAQHGFTSTEQTLIATAISEIARNILVYAVRGEILVFVVTDDGKAGIEIKAIDEGPGIPDIDRAMQDGYSTRKSLGMGLPGARRLMDEFEIQSTVDHGTTVTMRKWRR